MRKKLSLIHETKKKATLNDCVLWNHRDYNRLYCLNQIRSHCPLVLEQKSLSSCLKYNIYHHVIMSHNTSMSYNEYHSCSSKKFSENYILLVRHLSESQKYPTCKLFFLYLHSMYKRYTRFLPISISYSISDTDMLISNNCDRKWTFCSL